MATVTKPRNMLESLVRDGSFKWLLGQRSSFGDEFEEMGRSPAATKNWISELSPLANLVVRRCSKLLGISATDLQENFNTVASDSIKHPSQYARNFFEFCCFRALAVSVQVTGLLADKKFRRLTYDMMLAWETPAASSQPLPNVDEDLTVGLEAFSRIAPAVPIIANVVISENLFGVLTTSTGGRLQFSIYDKYLYGLERAIKKMKSQSDSNVLSVVRSSRREKILEMDGTVTTQPVLEHIGISTWPGRLTLSDHALYFEPLRMVSFDKPKIYDLSEDLKQVVKPELTGPWGTRLFDKAISYKSISLSEPVIIEFPELKGHNRRDNWLAIINEVLYVHRFINKFRITGLERDEAISKAVLGILRLQAIQELSSVISLHSETLLMFSLCDQLPGGDMILETLANMSFLRESDRTANYKPGGGMYSISASTMVSSLGFMFGTSSGDPNEAALTVGEITVGETSSLERVVRESRNSYKKVVLAQETVDGVKVNGIGTNVAVMKELLLPVIEIGRWLLYLAHWDHPLKSLVFCSTVTYVIWRGWLGYAFGVLLLFIAIFMVLTGYCNRGTRISDLKVASPPTMNTVEQLLAVQNSISQVEQLIQEGNVVLLKIRALLLSIFPQASDKVALALLCMALILALVPFKYIAMFCFVETFTRHSPPRKESSERFRRRLREWWFSIPAAPVSVEREVENRNRKRMMLY